MVPLLFTVARTVAVLLVLAEEKLWVAIKPGSCFTSRIRSSTLICFTFGLGGSGSRRITLFITGVLGVVEVVAVAAAAAAFFVC